MDVFCLGPNSEILRCRDCDEFNMMDSIYEQGLDSVATSFRSPVRIMMCGRKVQSTVFISCTERTINIWNEYPETKPDDVKITECNVCYSISFQVVDINNVGSMMTRDMVIDKCYPIPGTRKFYPTVDMEIRNI